MSFAQFVVPTAGEWLPVADALRTFGERTSNTVRLALPGSVTLEQWRNWRALRDSTFFMVRNRGGDVGERWPCGKCSTYHVERGVRIMDPVFHEFFTIACRPRPWRGLVDAMWGYASLTNNERLAARIEAWQPNLANPVGIAQAHPRTFGHMVPDDAEADVIAVAIGVLEPIDETKARQLARDINQRRLPEPFVL